MSYKRYLLIIFGIAAAGWISFGLVVTQLQPCTAPGAITICHKVAAFPLFLFFFSAFFAFTATFTLFGFGLRLWLHRSEIYLDHLSIALRQGVLLTLCSLLSLGLLLLKALTWWTGLLLIGVILLLELYFTRET